MGGGDLNMKKSWHPLLMKNQERVWLEEKKALEERKKLEQLRKEKEEERQLQELQRLQEEQTGRKRTEKLEWMYATPATGSGANSNELEDYLLGKKRVDKLLVGDENQALGASHKNFIAVQHANTVRDTAAKVREDPLFAIKQQEQATLQALRDNPLRLKEMQERNGLLPKSKPKKEKEKRRHKHRSSSRRQRRRSISRSRSLSPYHRSPDQRRDAQSHSRRSEWSRRGQQSSLSPSVDRYDRDRSSRPRRGSRSPVNRYDREAGDRHVDIRPSKDYRSSRRDSVSPPRSRFEDESPGSTEQAYIPPRSPSRRKAGADEEVAGRTEKLAAMLANASQVNDERKHRLALRLAEEKAELELENKLRARSSGSSFLSDQQKRVFGGLNGGLGEYMRRGKMGLVMERD